MISSVNINLLFLLSFSISNFYKSNLHVLLLLSGHEIVMNRVLFVIKLLQSRYVHVCVLVLSQQERLDSTFIEIFA
jgi:hypothetical protein